jgi:hypothetical protein
MKFCLRALPVFIALPALFFATGCSHGISGNGNITTETRPVTTFNRIDADGAFSVQVKQDNTESVRVEADENLQQYITVRTEGNTLYLQMRKHTQFNDIKKMVIHVSCRELSAIRTNIVGSFETIDTLRVGNLQVKTNSVGRTALLLNGNTLNADINSVGSCSLAGTIGDATINNAGVGQLSARNLKAGNLVLDNSGVGSAEVYADKTIAITSSGVGSVKYYGPASVTRLNASGVGKISSGN